MKKLIITALAALALAPAALADGVRVNDPTGFFSDENGNSGYVEVTDDGAQACNENEATPAGDQLTGYAYVSRAGQAPVNPTAGNEHVGAADYDGQTDADPGDGDESNDCPDAADGTTELP